MKYQRHKANFYLLTFYVYALNLYVCLSDFFSQLSCISVRYIYTIMAPASKLLSHEL